MFIEAIDNIPASDAWVFFAFSIDYSSGKVNAYVKSYDGITQPILKQNVVSYPEFALGKDSILILADVVGNNKYFQQVAGFKGTIGYVEMSKFFTDNLAFIWSGYASPQSQQYNSVLVDFTFDVDGKGKNLKNYGFIPQKEFLLLGNYQPLHEIDPNQSGVQFNQDSYLTINDVNFNQPNSQIKSALFLINFKYADDLPNKYVLLRRGQRSDPGFIEVSLQKVEGGRVIMVDVENQSNNSKPAIFASTSLLQPNVNYMIMTGVTQDIGGNLRIIYIDSLGGNNFNIAKEKASFLFDPVEIVAFQQPQGTQPFNGSVTVDRLIIFDSASPAVNYVNIHDAPNFYVINQTLPQDQYCLVRSNVYSPVQSD